MRREREHLCSKKKTVMKEGEEIVIQTFITFFSVMYQYCITYNNFFNPLQSKEVVVSKTLHEEGAAASDETLGDKATSGLASLGLRTDARADARGTRAASGAAVGGAEALATNELRAGAVADVLGA